MRVAAVPLAALSLAALSLAALSLAALPALAARASLPVPAVPVPEGAHAAGAFDRDEPRVEARLLIHPDDSAEHGAVRVGVLLEMDPGWHVYGTDPGQSGLPTTLRWSIDTGRIAPMPWPPVQTFREDWGDESDALTTYGYEGRVLLPARAEPREGRAASVLVDVELLACRSECIPASFTLTRTLPQEPALEATHALVVRTLFAGLADPNEPRASGSEAPGGESASRPRRAPADRPGLLRACLLGGLGGLVLNGMPCVLPVLATKLVGLTAIARRRRREVVAHALAYSAGVLGAMALLASAVVALRAAGAAVGWGFQFQEPLFVAAVSATLVVFALNLLGVFEIQADPGRLAALGAEATGRRRSFFDGLLAVVLATPCSAPFLGTAVGFAFASPAPTVVAIFLSIGVGLAAPFTLVALTPGAARLLPRPGPWMLGLRRILGLALLATAVWLVWIAGRVVGPVGMATLVALLVAIAAGTWIVGALQTAGALRSTLPAALALVALAPLGLDLAPLPAAPASAAPSVPEGEERYDRSALEAALARGRVAFVYFTADWCLTCKVNERRTLAHPRIREQLQRLDVAVLRADWTRRDAFLGAELARFGRSGVPLYLVFRPDAPDAPAILPELLDRDTLRAALRDAASVTARTRPARVGGEEQSAGAEAARQGGRNT